MGIAEKLAELTKDLLEVNPNEPVFPQALVEKMLETRERCALENGHRDERTELVCRLFANDMTADEISLILKIRLQEIQEIENDNKETIADYAKKLKARRKSRERAAL